MDLRLICSLADAMPVTLLLPCSPPRMLLARVRLCNISTHLSIIRLQGVSAQGVASGGVRLRLPCSPPIRPRLERRACRMESHA